VITKQQIHRLKSLEEKERKASLAARAYREQLAAVCDHPTEFVREFQQSRGNGFGRLVTQDVKSCKICFAENQYGTWTSRAELDAYYQSRNDD